MLRLALAPLAALYAAAGAARIARARPQSVGAPVICVGNVTLGGVGKTPIVRTLRHCLADAGIAAHTLSRGHGGAQKGPLRVDPALHAAADVGDEPLLHAADGPAWIARNRAAGAQAAANAGAAAIVLDDGFQNPALAKDLSLLAFDGRSGLGNRRVFPAGPLREPAAAALARADAVILVDAPDAPPPWLESFPRPILHAAIVPAGPAPSGPLVAFAGIGQPTKFLDTLTQLGAEVAEMMPYPDHHVYSERELSWLRRLAMERGARLITTEKDLVRLSAPARADILTLPVAARFADPTALNALLAPVIARARRSG